MIVSGMIWFGACVGNIAGPFFYLTSQAPSYPMGIGSLLAANILEVVVLLALRYSFMWENKRKERQRAALCEQGSNVPEETNATAFTDMTDKENPNFEYVY